jgi:hypothetical protein
MIPIVDNQTTEKTGGRINKGANSTVITGIFQVEITRRARTNKPRG